MALIPTKESLEQKKLLDEIIRLRQVNKELDQQLEFIVGINKSNQQILETYQNATDRLYNANKELVEMLEDIRNRMEVGVSSYEQVELALTELITKHKQNERVLGANQQLTRLTEMSGDHFDQIFIKGFAPSKIKSDVAKLNSLFGFHDMIAKYGHFESYSTAAKLNYDVEFKLDRVQALDTTHDKGKEESC